LFIVAPSWEQIPKKSFFFRARIFRKKSPKQQDARPANGNTKGHAATTTLSGSRKKKDKKKKRETIKTEPARRI